MDSRQTALAVPNMPVGGEETSANSFCTDELFHSLDEERVVVILAQGEYQWRVPASALNQHNDINVKSNRFCVGRDSRHKWYLALQENYSRFASADGLVVELANQHSSVTYNREFALRKLDFTLNLDRCPVKEVIVDCGFFLNGELLFAEKTVASPIKPVVYCFPVNRLIGNGRPLDANVFLVRLQFGSETSKLKLHRGGENLATNFYSMLTSGRFADLTITCNDGTRILAHRCVLAARSPVFCAMFNHAMLEQQSRSIAITDFDTEIIQSFVTFLYTGHIHDFDEVIHAHDLLKIADKYDVSDMIDMCAIRLGEMLSTFTAVDILLMADAHNLKLLKEKAMEYISDNKSNFTDVDMYDPLLEFEPRLLAEILAHNAKL